MTLHFDQLKTVGEISQQFARAFPFLRLAFYKKPHSESEGSFAKYRLPDDFMFRTGRHLAPGSTLEVLETQSVSDFEQAMEKQFGLHVQICRKYGATWVQTIDTDRLTLEEQNLLGQQASAQEIHPDLAGRIEPADF